MVTVAIAGGSGQVAREVLDALLDTNKHKIIVLTRASPTPDIDGKIEQRTVDYHDTEDLVNALNGVHTVLSFVQILLDVDQKAQRNLIDAAIKAGVKRFAPSEYGSAGTMSMPWWEGKQKIREYLKEVNKPSKILEFCLFQPGLFLNYLAFPYKTSKHLNPLGTVCDFQNHRALVVEGYESTAMTWTSVADFSAILAMAVDYKGEWPEIGGIQGDKVTGTQLIQAGEKIRCQPFTVEKLNLKDLEEGKLKSSWSLSALHKAVSKNEAERMLEQVTVGMLLSTAKGAWEGSDEWNQIFSDYRFTPMEDFIASVWGVKDK